MSSTRIRGYHTDAYGHVNNARYLEFLEEARWSFFEQSRLPLSDGLQLVVAEIHIRYRRAATVGDTLAVTCRVQSWETRRIVLQQTAKLGNGKTAVEAEIVLIPVQNGKSCTLPEALQTALAEHCAKAV
ncbi:MAG: thioesterase family protein [Neisseria sp.]|nr:thioesterase family protein [Neisseria sp.]